MPDIFKKCWHALIAPFWNDMYTSIPEIGAPSGDWSVLFLRVERERPRLGILGSSFCLKRINNAQIVLEKWEDEKSFRKISYKNKRIFKSQKILKEFDWNFGGNYFFIGETKKCYGLFAHDNN